MTSSGFCRQAQGNDCLFHLLMPELTNSKSENFTVVLIRNLRVPNARDFPMDAFGHPGQPHHRGGHHAFFISFPSVRRDLPVPAYCLFRFAGQFLLQKTCCCPGKDDVFQTKKEPTRTDRFSLGQVGKSGISMLPVHVSSFGQF